VLFALFVILDDFCRFSAIFVDLLPNKTSDKNVCGGFLFKFWHALRTISWTRILSHGQASVTTPRGACLLLQMFVKYRRTPYENTKTPILSLSFLTFSRRIRKGRRAIVYVFVRARFSAQAVLIYCPREFVIYIAWNLSGVWRSRQFSAYAILKKNCLSDFSLDRLKLFFGVIFLYLIFLLIENWLSFLFSLFLFDAFTACLV
jgi:hypothetical protein